MPEEPLTPKMETLNCLTDVCIICCSLSRHSASNPPPHKFPSRRKDSLCRHLIDSHLTCARDRISCTWAACHSVPKFTQITEFLAHAATVHKYDVQIKLQHLPKKSQIACSNTLSIESSGASLKSDSRSSIETPTSSIDFEMGNINLCLLKSHTAVVMKPLLRWKKRLEPQ